MTFVIAAMTIVIIFTLRVWEDSQFTSDELEHLNDSERRTKVL